MELFIGNSSSSNIPLPVDVFAGYVFLDQFLKYIFAQPKYTLVAVICQMSVDISSIKLCLLQKYLRGVWIQDLVDCLLILAFLHQFLE